MVELKISLFGGFEVEVSEDGKARENKKRHIGKPAQLLLAFILLHRDRPHTREALAERIWPEEDKPRGRLRTTLWRLKDCLEPTLALKGKYVKTTEEGGVCFNSNSCYWLDVAEFEKNIATPMTFNGRDCPDRYLNRVDKALALYGGDLLEGFYDEWIVRERERLRCLYIETLEHQFFCCMKQRAYHRALSYARRILDHDPIREHIHRDMMRIYAACHRRAEAVRQYQVCVDILKKELDIAPMEETTSLYNKLRHGSDCEYNSVAANETECLHGPYSKTILDLNEAKRRIESAIMDIANDSHKQ